MCFSLKHDCTHFSFFQKVIFLHFLSLIWFITSTFPINIFIVDNQQHKRFFIIRPIHNITRSLSYFCLSFLIYSIPLSIFSFTVAIFFAIQNNFLIGIITFFSLIITGINSVIISGLLFLFFKFLLPQNIFFTIVIISESIGLFAIRFLRTFGIKTPYIFNEKFLFVQGVNHIWGFYKNDNANFQSEKLAWISGIIILGLLYSFILNAYLIKEPVQNMLKNSYGKKFLSLKINKISESSLIRTLYKKITKYDTLYKKYFYYQVSKIFSLPILILFISLRKGTHGALNIEDHLLMLLFFTLSLSDLIVPGYFSINPKAMWHLKIFCSNNNYVKLKKIYYGFMLKRLLLTLCCFLCIICLLSSNYSYIYMSFVIITYFFITYFTMVKLYSNMLPFSYGENDSDVYGSLISLSSWIFIPLIYIGFKKTFQNYLGMIIFSIALILFAVFQYRRAYYKLKIQIVKEILTINEYD